MDKRGLRPLLSLRQPEFGGGEVCSENMQMICNLLQESRVFFRLFFCFKIISIKDPFGFHPTIVPYMKRLEKHVALFYLNLMIIKKLWLSRHAFCYIMDDESFYNNPYFMMAGDNE